jgi:hypothetical protein
MPHLQRLRGRPLSPDKCFSPLCLGTATRICVLYLSKPCDIVVDVAFRLNPALGTLTEQGVTEPSGTNRHQPRTCFGLIQGVSSKHRTSPKELKEWGPVLARVG